MENLGKILWGLAFIVIGIIIGTNALELTDIILFFDGWWTLFIIIPNFIGLLSSKDNKLGNFIGLSIGVVLLLVTRGILDFDMISSLFIPFIFIIIGLSIIFNNVIRDNITEKIKAKSDEGLESIIATFGEQKVNKDDEDFNGADIDSVFGNVVLDLRRANIDKEAVIKASAIFAGVEIIVPNDVNIKIKSTPIFGGVSNKVSNKTENEKTIYLETFCLFGGVEIR